MSILRKIDELLEDPRIVEYRRHSRKGTLSKDHDYEWIIDVAPREGFRRIDSDSISELAQLQKDIFGTIREGPYEVKPQFTDDYVIGRYEPMIHLHNPCFLGWSPGIFCAGGVTTSEPVGILEEWEDYHSAFHILPEYEHEFSAIDEKDVRGEEKDKSHTKKLLHRHISVDIAPSLEYLERLYRIVDEQEQLLGVAGRDKFNRHRFDELEKNKNELGFIKVGEIFVKNYNKMFG